MAGLWDGILGAFGMGPSGAAGGNGILQGPMAGGQTLDSSLATNPGILQQITQGFQDHNNALLGMSAGLLGGGTLREGMGRGFANFANGGRMDAATLKDKRQEAASKLLAQYALKGNEDPGLAGALAAFPEATATLALDKINPKKKDDYTLGAGEQRYDATGKLIATGPLKAETGAGADMAARHKWAIENGKDPADPRIDSWIRTGKDPREDAQPLTAVDKKAIIESDELVAANQNVITSLDKLLGTKQPDGTYKDGLNDKSYGGATAGARTWLGNNLPDYMVPDVVAAPGDSAATSEMDNEITGNVLSTLKATFGGAPTEGERKVLEDLEGSSSKPPEVRKRIFERAKRVAEARLKFNQQRAAELRGGTYYKPGSDAGGPAVIDGYSITPVP